MANKCDCVYEEFCTELNGKEIVLPTPCQYRKARTDCVAVVRCIDCKYLGTGGCAIDTYAFEVTEDTFCSYGERKDNGK